MYRFLIFIIFFLSSLLIAQNVRVEDYQVAVSRAQNLIADGTWNWAQQGDQVTSNNANGSLTMKTFFSSLPTAWFINLDAVAGKNFSDYSHNINLSSSFRKYVWNDRDLFASGRLTLSHANFYKQVESRLTVGFGYGRYINATSLAKAVRIEDHLIREKIISEYLSKEVMVSVANIIEREQEYKDTYGNTSYETFWFDDIEREIKKSDEVSSDGIGSIGILRMRQVIFNINERVNDRYYGWDVVAGILFPLSTRDKSPAGNPNLSVTAEYSYPINWNMQINTSLISSTPIDSGFFKTFDVSTKLDFIYELSNRINFVANYQLVSNKVVENDKFILDHYLNASFLYYLENNVYFIFSSGFAKQGSAPRSLRTTVGIQYNLL